MIRKFENSDIDDIMQIWKNVNIEDHNFISKEYWENDYDYVRNILPKAEIYVYVDNNEIIGFIGMKTILKESLLIQIASIEE